jgi:FemAB family protein
MIEKINKIFEALNTGGLECIPKYKNEELWDKLFCQLHYQPIYFSSEMIAYHHAYLACSGDEVTDCSVILLSGGKVCGLFVLTSCQSNSGLSLTSCGQAIFEPLFVTDTPRKLKKRICSMLINFLGNAGLFSRDSVGIQQSKVDFSNDIGCSDWYQKALSAGGKPILRHDLYVDLSLSMDEIRSNFRKSYKPLINKGLREWGHSLMTFEDANHDIWNEFKVLHEFVSGRVARSAETWMLQWEMLLKGKAFLVIVRDLSDQRFVGGAFFQHTAHESVYSVGVYDRALNKKPIGHIAQQLAIEYMKSIGIFWYKIGERLYPQLNENSTSKEIDISSFKEGFATNMLSKVDFIIPFSVEQRFDDA